MPSQIFSELSFTHSSKPSNAPNENGIEDDSLDYEFPLCGTSLFESDLDGLRALELNRPWSPYTDSDTESDSSSIAYDQDFESLVDDILNNVDHSDPFDVTRDDITVKAFPLTHPPPELYMLLELNLASERDDPWNPIPHIIRAVERPQKDLVCLCFAPLGQFDRPPLKIVSNYIDLFRQLLEGTTFLHEHGIVSLSLSDPSNIMVDLGLLPSSDIDSFDRTRYPVKYYITNLSTAYRYDEVHTRRHGCTDNPFAQDVRECGVLIDGLLGKVELIAPTFKPLVEAMSTGEFGANDARQLFETLCKSLEPSVFEKVVQDICI